MKKNRGQNIFLYPRRPFSRSHFSPTGPFSSAPFTPISASYLFNPSLRAFQPPLLSNPTTRLSPPCLFPFRVDNRLVRVNASVEWQHRGGRASLKLIMKLNATTAFKSCLPLTNKQGYAELSKGSSVDTSESVSGLATSILGERSGKRFALTISGVARKNGRDCSVCCAPRSRRSRRNQSKWLDKSSVKFAPTS